MNAVTSSKFQHITVLREQRDSRRTFAFKNTLKVFRQCKTGPFEFGRSDIAAKFRSLNEFLGKCFHGAQHFGRRLQAHHLQSTDGLVKLLAGNAQMAGIKFSNVGAPGQLGVSDKPAHCLGCALQGFSKLLEHPGQWPQVCDHRVLVADSGCVRLHGFVHSCL